MILVESIYRKPITGYVGGNNNYYVIRNKETQEYDTGDGELCDDIMEANWYQSYADVKACLECFDEPEEFEIILFSCTIHLEEIL